MKRQIICLAVLFSLIIYSCSMLRVSESQRITGKWTAFHQSGAEIIFEFKPDMTMTCTVPDAPDYSFTANYTVDNSKNPTTVDLLNIESMNIQEVCLAIIQFSDDNKMEFFGIFGEPGQVSRPSEFNKYADIPELYLEFNKATNDTK